MVRKSSCLSSINIFFTRPQMVAQSAVNYAL
jgi:hypothetical protein